MDTMLYICIALLAVVTVMCAIMLVKLSAKAKQNDGLAARLDSGIRETELKLESLRRELKEQLALNASLAEIKQSAFLDTVTQRLSAIEKLEKANGEAQRSFFAGGFDAITKGIAANSEATAMLLKQLEQRLGTFSAENEQRLDNIRTMVSKHLSAMQEDNNKKLEDMRTVVDEKLSRTLNERMTQSFTLVNERLEQVYKGLGEMQTLATGVGDLKKVLTNVKTRGILGEVQLGAILSEMLSPEQYMTNAQIKRNTFVEFAVKLPGDDSGTVLLPIDSKFPTEAYYRLTDAYDSGNTQQIKAEADALKAALIKSAGDIKEKYIAPPETTSYAIMFLPTEGLYAEAVRLGLIETLQRQFKVTVAGPSTMAALLNSLQMGFRSYLVHKRSGEVWNVLNEVKGEFDKFADALALTQQRLEQANTELDKLVGTRTRQLRKKLGKVASGEGMLIETQGEGTLLEADCSDTQA